MAANYWDKEKELNVISKGPKAEVRISLVEKNGKQFVNVREWYCTANDPTWKPSKSGMSIPVGTVGEEIASSIKVAMTQSF